MSGPDAQTVQERLDLAINKLGPNWECQSVSSGVVQQKDGSASILLSAVMKVTGNRIDGWSINELDLPDALKVKVTRLLGERFAHVASLRCRANLAGNIGHAKVTKSPRLLSQSDVWEIDCALAEHGLRFE